MRKFAVLVLLLLNFLVLPNAVAENKVVIDRITQAEAEELDIQIPDEVPPGQHSITIEVYDENGTISTRDVPFYKDPDGTIRWDDISSELKLDVSDEKDLLVDKKNTTLLKPYDPLQDPETTKGLQIAAFAALAALTSIKRNDKGMDSQDDQIQDDQNQDQESLQSVSPATLKLLKDFPGKGDLSNTWSNQFTIKTDVAFASLAHRFNRFSPFLARTVQDGNTIRAVFGPLAGLLRPIAFVLGIVAAFNTGGQALPPAWGLVALIMAIAIFDAFSGLIAGSVFFLAALFTGNITNRPEFLTAIGLIILFFAPALIASSFRPFRRLVSNADDKWERITDYALALLLTFWVITKIVAAMNGLARLDLPITDYGTDLAWIAAVLLFVRISLEDIAVAHYPMRLRALNVEIKSPSRNQELRLLALKTFVFFIMAAPFVGSLLTLVLGTILFVIPQISAIRNENKLSKKKIYLPKGVLKTVVMIFILAVASKLTENAFSSPAEFLKWSFVVLALPSFVLQYIDSVTDAQEAQWKSTKNGQRIYRLGGAIIFAIMVLVVQGVDITAWLF